MLARLRREREGADRLYNEALTRLDHAVRRLREMPPAPPPYDESQIAPPNEGWALLQPVPATGGWLKRLRARIVLGAVAPFLARQEAFNAAVVDHVNRNRAIHREAGQSTAAPLDVINEELAHLIDFQTRLILFAQQITPY